MLQEAHFANRQSGLYIGKIFLLCFKKKNLSLKMTTASDLFSYKGAGKFRVCLAVAPVAHSFGVSHAKPYASSIITIFLVLRYSEHNSILTVLKSLTVKNLFTFI